VDRLKARKMERERRAVVEADVPAASFLPGSAVDVAQALVAMGHLRSRVAFREGWFSYRVRRLTHPPLQVGAGLRTLIRAF
jgi:hypothetical protein